MDICEGLTPAQRAGLRIAVPKGECAMSKPIYEDPAGRTGAYYHLSVGAAEACAQMGVTEGEYLERCGGRVRYLADRRVKLSAAGDDAGRRRRAALELADQLGVDREVVEAELAKEGI